MRSHSSRYIASAGLKMGIAILFAAGFSQSLHADDTVPSTPPAQTSKPQSVEPYIDSVRKQMKSESEDPDNGGTPSTLGSPTSPNSNSPYIDSVKAKMKAEDNSGSYTQQLKQKLDPNGTPPAKSYSQDVQKQIGPGDSKSAIQDVKNGNSELHYEKKGEITSTFGFTLGVGLTRTINAIPDIATGRPFLSVYGSNYAPDFKIFYDFRPFHASNSDFIKRLGIYASLGAGIFSGFGQFQVPPNDATTSNNTPLSSASTVYFHFIEIPAVIGLDYRLQVSKYVVPFVTLGPSLTGFYEERNDGGSANKALAVGVYGNIGIAFSIDWISHSNDWDQYNENGIKHSFFTIEYSHLHTGNPINVDISGPSLGFAFEM